MWVPAPSIPSRRRRRHIKPTKEKHMPIFAICYLFSGAYHPSYNSRQATTIPTMELEPFEELRHYPTTSWAIWHERGDNSVTFFRSQLERLHARSVIVGLNRSESWQGDLVDRMANFHARGHTGDRRLKRHIQDAGLENIIGAFMTDVSDEIKTDSGKVKVDSPAATKEFVAKVTSIDTRSDRTIVCLGDAAFDILREGLRIPKASTPIAGSLKLRKFECPVSGEDWQVFRVWHSGNYGKYIHKSEGELAAQLAYIDSSF
jgi:hypothetical protein